MEIKDYYAVLEVDEKAPVDEIKRSYRKLARKYHPDVSKLPDAEKRFKEINEAWEVIKDPVKRQHYDRVRAGGAFEPFSAGAAQGGFDAGQSERGFSQGEDFSDFFNALFGGMEGAFGRQAHPGGFRSFHAKGQDLQVKLKIPLSVAFKGGIQNIQIQVPAHSPPGQTTLQTKNLQVKIPAGVMHGSQIRLAGQGGPGIGNAPAGDLYIEIEIEHHPFFSLQHKDVHLKLPITPWEAALGANIKVPTLGGEVSLKIPQNAQSGQTLRLKDRGLPGNPPGHQYVMLQIIVPKADTDAKTALYQEMAKMMPFNPREKLGV
ncbi:MAG: DnaJ C-terminal domain-containing protein [Candidatus Berkiellales bacterium]